MSPGVFEAWFDKQGFDRAARWGSHGGCKEATPCLLMRPPLGHPPRCELEAASFCSDPPGPTPKPETCAKARVGGSAPRRGVGGAEGGRPLPRRERRPAQRREDPPRGLRPLAAVDGGGGADRQAGLQRVARAGDALIHTCMHRVIHLHVCVCVYDYICVCMYVYIHICIDRSIHRHVFIYVYVYA